MGELLFHKHDSLCQLLNINGTKNTVRGSFTKKTTHLVSGGRDQDFSSKKTQRAELTKIPIVSVANLQEVSVQMFTSVLATLDGTISKISLSSSLSLLSSNKLKELKVLKQNIISVRSSSKVKENKENVSKENVLVQQNAKGKEEKTNGRKRKREVKKKAKGMSLRSKTNGKKRKTEDTNASTLRPKILLLMNLSTLLYGDLPQAEWEQSSRRDDGVPPVVRDYLIECRTRKQPDSVKKFFNTNKDAVKTYIKELAKLDTRLTKKPTKEILQKLLKQLVRTCPSLVLGGRKNEPCVFELTSAKYAKRSKKKSLLKDRISASGNKISREEFYQNNSSILDKESASGTKISRGEFYQKNEKEALSIIDKESASGTKISRGEFKKLKQSEKERKAKTYTRNALEKDSDGMTPNLVDSDLQLAVDACYKVMDTIKDDNGHTMRQSEFEGYMYIYAAQKKSIINEWRNTLSRKKFVWVYDDQTGDIRQANDKDIEAEFKHVVFDDAEQNNAFNNHSIERILHTKFRDHPHKLWEGIAKGRAGGKNALGSIGEYFVGVTYRTKPLPNNWCVQKNEPQKKDFPVNQKKKETKALDTDTKRSFTSTTTLKMGRLF